MQYNEANGILSGILTRIINLGDIIGVKAVKEALEEMHLRFDKSCLQLVVLGQYKRGKSTFINYILGDNILPTGAVPLTSIITKISYSLQKRAFAIFNDDTQSEVSLSDIYDYCTEAGNPLNIKNIKEIRIEYPFEFIGEDIIFIDTPGIASIYKHNTDIAYSSISKADAAVFVLSVDPAISDAEKAFLSQISCDVDRIFFLLNKTDYLEDRELRDVMEFTERVLADILQRNDVKVFPVSLKLALEGRTSNNIDLIEKSRINMPISKIKELLINEKDHILANSHIRRIRRILTMCEIYLKSAINLRKRPLEEIEKNLGLFEEFIKGISTGKKEMDILFRNNLKESFDAMDEEMHEFKKKAEIQAIEEIRAFSSVYEEVNRLKRQNGLEDQLETILIKIVDEFRRAIWQKTEIWYKSVISNHYKRFRRLVSRVKETVQDLFELDMEHFDSSIKLEMNNEFKYKIGYDIEALEINPVYFTFPLPKSIASKIILGRILKRIGTDVDRNLGRIRYDFLRIIEGSFERLNKELTTQIDSMVDIVRKLACDTISNYRKEEREFLIQYSTYGSLLTEIGKMEREVDEVEKSIIRQ